MTRPIGGSGGSRGRCGRGLFIFEPVQTGTPLTLSRQEINALGTFTTKANPQTRALSRVRYVHHHIKLETVPPLTAL